MKNAERATRGLFAVKTDLSHPKNSAGRPTPVMPCETCARTI